MFLIMKINNYCFMLQMYAKDLDYGTNKKKKCFFLSIHLILLNFHTKKI